VIASINASSDTAEPVVYCKVGSNIEIPLTSYLRSFHHAHFHNSPTMSS
jgi:hypothetical protein